MANFGQTPGEMARIPTRGQIAGVHKAGWKSDAVVLLL